MRYLSLKRLFCVTAVLCMAIMPSYANVHNEFKQADGKTINTRQLADSLNSYAQQVLEKWQLPGMAVAISVNDSVILCKGYGVKELAPADGVGFRGLKASKEIASGGVPAVANISGEPIDSKTLFQIGSVSKSFTATVMGQLVDEGLVKWEDTVKNILPDFKMYDSWVTENAQVKDIMTHRLGLLEQAGTYFPNLGYSRDDIYKMIGLIKPAYSFRGDYQYNNITFVIAEKIIEKVTGKSWEQNVKERIFIPAGMKSSSLNAEGYSSATNVATPHDYSFTQPQRVAAMFDTYVPYSAEEPKIVTLPLYGDEQALYWLTGVGPAGSVSSNVEDMIRYAMMHMNNGFIVDGKDTTKVMSEKAMRSIHKGITITSQADNRTTLYAQCWFVEQNNRYRLYFHTGTTWGMTALCFFVPQYKLCGVVLVNSEAGANPRYAIMNRTIDLVSGAPYDDYNSRYFNSWLENSKKNFAEANAKIEKQQKEMIALNNPKGKKVKKSKKDALPLFVQQFNPATDGVKYVGKYVKDELFGNAEITLENGELYIAIGKNGYKNILKHVKDNRFEFRSDGHGFPVNFTVDEAGNVKELEVEFNYNEEKDFGTWSKLNN